ncbi:MAG: response regulator [Melioribacteraceae bacterium]|nr:response regulator [Melioribacteraceae bacterium]
MNSTQIMIVEDERIVAEDIQETLEEFGYNVVGIEDTGENAVNMASKLKPDLILMDIMLKGEMNGIQAAFKINDNEEIPIIYLTAYTDNNTAQEAINTNPSGYLVKPFNKRSLYASVEIALNKLKEKRKTQDTNGGLDEENRYHTSISDHTIEETRKPIATTSKKQETPHLLKTLRKYNLSLTDLLEGIKTEHINQFELNKLIECTFKLAVFNVRKNSNRIFTINKKWELSVEDIAIEAISNLFVKNEKRDILNIKYSLLNWNTELTNDLDSLYFLHKTVSISVNQYINKLIKDTDPFFARVLDSVNHFMKKNNFKKTNYFGTTYLIDESLSSISGTPINSEEFLNLPISFNQEKPHIVYRVFDYLEANTDYFPAIPLNALVKRIIQNYKHTELSQSQLEPSPMGKICVDDIVKKALNQVYKKIEDTYKKKTKLSDSEIAAINYTLKDIANDLKEGQLNWGLYNYLEMHITDLTKEDYKKNYQNIIEYLVKKLKTFIKEQIN